MANIMLTDYCNLNCRYCFANEFVNKNPQYISIENFQKALDFLLTDEFKKPIGLIGGEPTLHPQFSEILRILIRDFRVPNFVIYTNGLKLREYPDLITHPKAGFLINCNSPDDIGEKNFRKLVNNLDWLLEEKLFKSHVTLGINLYSPNQNYQYIMDLLQKYQFDHVRMSVTVPNLHNNQNINALGYFESMKEVAFRFIQDAAHIGVVPRFDCNKIPACVFPPIQRELFGETVRGSMLEERFRKSNIGEVTVKCDPVIDITPDLIAVRCFGLSAYTKQRICDFRSVKELRDYYARTVDAYQFNTIYAKPCIECKLRLTAKCSGGCLAYKIFDIMKMQEYAKSLEQSYS